jgi:glycosyltransferase involved in cell wall biosynthesis
MSYDVVFCLTGDIRKNSRALRQLRALTHAGVNVLGIGMAATASDDRTGATRLLHIPHPSGRGPRWFWAVHRAFRRALQGTEAPVYHASDLFVLPAMAEAAKRSGGSYTYDSRELYPHVGATAGKPWASAFWRLIESRFIRGSSATFTVCDSIAERLSDTYRIERPAVVPNVPEHGPPQPTTYLRDWCGIPDGELLLLYQGHLKPGRGCEQLLDAVTDVPAVRGVFMGAGPMKQELEARASEAGITDRVYFHPPTPPDELLPVTSSADVGICLIEPITESLRLSLPNKLFEYLWSGLPVVASNLPEISRVVDGFEVGITVDPFSRVAIASAVRRLASDPSLIRDLSSRTPRVVETYAWSRASEAFVKPFQALTAP